MAKILISFLLLLALSNWLYFKLKAGDNKCFNYDLTKRSTFVGDYQMLDAVPNIETTGDGVRVNFYEPDSKSYYTKVFQYKDSQIFTVRTPGIHKVCFEGTKNLFTSIDSVRVTIKMHDEIKHEKTLDKVLKTDDLKESKESILNLSATLVLIQQSLTEGEEKLRDFENLRNQYVSRMGWGLLLTVLTVIGCTCFEGYLFRKAMLKGVDKMK